jgi:asparagine synthase (glutamine-hydrolysing)
MMVHVHFVYNRGRAWHRHGAASVKGFAFREGELLKTPALASYLSGSQDDFAEKVAGLSGEFAAVLLNSVTNMCVAAVDRVRTTPLFYGREADQLYLSDDASWVARQTKARVKDDRAVAAFLLQGCVIGSDTLVHSVKQIQAGQSIQATEAGWQAQHYFAYGSERTAPVSDLKDREALIEEGIAMYESIFARTLASVGDRPLVVPLSGGLDSRLIAFMLARLGRKDTLCYSYGRVGGFEAVTSQRIAEHLGLSWAFVPYTHAHWHEWYRSTAYQQYRQEAAQLTSLEHEQDWPAVLALKQRDLLKDGAVFLPGHSGDFVAGSHLPASVFNPKEKQDPVLWLWNKYFQFWPRHALAPSLVKGLQDRIGDHLNLTKAYDTLTPFDAARVFEYYGWRERQAKLIVNSVRVYEHHGYDWRVPLWDTDVMSFWPKVPLYERQQKRLYRAILKRLMGEVFDVPYVPASRVSWYERWHRMVDRDYHRYGMYVGPSWTTALFTKRIGHLVTSNHSVVQALAKPLRLYPPQALPLNALIGLFQVQDVIETYGT